MSLIQSRFSLFLYHDAYVLHYPVKKILIQQMRSGLIPYWNPTASFGQPLLANPNLEPFYPDNLVFLLLPFDFAWNFHFWFHWIFGMFGFFLLLRACNREPKIAWLGSIWWGGCGYVLSQFTFANLIATLAWLPWIVYFTRLLVEKPGIKSVAMLALALGFQFLAGEPVTTFGTWLVLAFFLIEWRKDLSLRKIWMLALSGILAAFIALPQIIAFREVYPILVRSWQHNEFLRTYFSFEPRRLWEWLIPNCGGVPYEKAPNLFPQSLFAQSSILIPSVHLSFLLWFSLLLSLRSRRYVLLFGVAFFFLIALGSYGPLWGFLYRTVPRFDELRFPIKFFAPCLALMIFLGTDAFQHWLTQPSRSMPIVLFFALWTSGIAFYIFAIHPSTLFEWTQVGVALLLCILLVFVLRFRKHAFLAYAILEALIGARYLWQGINKDDLQAASFLPGAHLYFSPAALSKEQGYKNSSELYAARTRNAYPLYGSVQGFSYALDHSLDGMYSFYNEYLGAFLLAQSAEKRYEILSYLGVDQIIDSEDLSIQDWQKRKLDPLFLYWRKPAPSVFATTKLQSKATVEQTFKGLAAGEGPFSRWPIVNQRIVIPAKLNFHQITPSRFQIDLQSDGSVFLVTRITFVNRWKAEGILKNGDRISLPVNQVDLAFIGLEIPSGTQRVILYYDSAVTFPLLLAWLLLLSVLVVASSIAIFV